MIQTVLDQAPIVVAVDSSDDAQEAAAWAAERASEWGSPLYMVAAATSGPAPCWLGMSRVAAWRAGHEPDTIESVPGDVLQVIGDRGAHARMVVVPGTVSAAVSATLAERVGCPVVVCRDGRLPSVLPASQPPVDSASPASRTAAVTGAGSHS
jgi:nucleotide-binding universal stress UspA family protein